MRPRPHQIKAMDMIWLALGCTQRVLLKAACSAGKTIMFSLITKRVIRERPTARVLILLDMEVLVTQTRDKLIAAVPELQLQIGIACASVSAFKDTTKSVTIASRQSLANVLGSCEPFHLCIVDEVHMMGIPKEKDVEPCDQYAEILQTLWSYNPKMRLLGVTATDYRLNDGYIHGDKNAPGCMPYFDEVHHKITVAELTAAGYLAPLVGVTACPDGMKSQLSHIGMVAGEYNQGRLSDLMEQGVHIGSAIEAWREHALSRNKTLAFCVTIKHAERLAEAFTEAGIPATAIHSELSPLELQLCMSHLEDDDSHIKVFTSVAKLTKGLDVISIDCLIMARPTKSTALYAQMLGRGQRIAPGKENCVVIDIVGNNTEHGTDLDKLKVTYKRGVGDEEGTMPTKECPKCACLLHPAVRVCPECGHIYPDKDFEELEKPEFVEVDYCEQVPVQLKITNMFPLEHIAKKKKGEKEEDRRTLMKIQLECSAEKDSMNSIDVNIWMCFIDDGYSGFAVEKTIARWTEMCGTTCPSSTAEALDRKDDIMMPEEALIDISGKWPDLLEIYYPEDIAVQRRTVTPAMEVEELGDIPF